MEKTVTVGNHDINLKTTAALPRIYRQMFNRDIFVDFERLQQGLGQQDGFSTIPIELLTVFEDIAFTMAKHADSSIPENAEAWLEGLETFDIYVILPHIIDMWQLDNLTTSSEKKKKDKQSEK